MSPAAHPENHAAQVISKALRRLILKEVKHDTPRFLIAALWVVCGLEAIAGVLHIVSAIAPLRNEGCWFFKIEKNGMIRPNTRILIPVWVLLYIAFSLPTLIFLLRDLDSKVIISAPTALMNFCTYFVLLSTGWTKIWNVLRAVPLTKYGLTSARQPNGESNVTYFRPRTINLLSAFFYGFPVIFGGLPVCLITKEISEINKTFLEYSHSYSTIHNGRTTTTQSMTEFNAETTKQTSSMIYSGEKLVFLWRLLSTGYCCNIVILFLIMAFGYFRIFQAVRYQTQTFRKSFEQHTSLAIRSHPVERSSTLKSTSISEGCNKPSVNFTQLTERAWIPQTIASWSPTSHQEPDSLRNINYPPSNSHSPTLGTQEWQSVNREKALSQYKALIKYERNLVWQASCNALIMLSFLGMNVAVWCNWMQVPTRHSLSDLTWFIITWSSVSWVFAVGLPAGLVACLSSRSPPITFLRENVQCAGPEHR